MNKFFFPLLAIIAALGLYFMYIRPTMEEIAIAEEKEARFERQVSEAKEVENIIARLEMEFESISDEDLIKIEYVLPKIVDLPRTIQTVQGIVEKSSAEISGIQIASDSSIPRGSIKEHALTIGLKTEYTTFLEILRNIESSLQFSNISSINIGGNVNSGAGAIEKVDAPYVVTLKFYQAI